MDTLHSITQQLQTALCEKDSAARHSTYKGFLSGIKENRIATVPTPDFKPGLRWINTSEPLSIYGNLKGKVLILDFWTYCCVNCLHILPDLHEIEQKFPVEDGVVVIGVHCAKFPNEKIDDNIVDAVRKYGIHHAVVNDSDATLWRELGIQCWPTVVVIGPTGLLLSQFIGEGHKEEICDFITCTLQVYEDSIDRHSSLPIMVGESSRSSSLLYPSKLAVHGDELIISDTGNHRVVICTFDGSIKKVIGSGKEGCEDGSYTDCSFMSPQGVCRIGDVIYVVDSLSHHVRAIHITEEKITTIAGTGVQGNDKLGGEKGCRQALSTPWDVIPYCSKHMSTGITEAAENDMLLIAMAGTHQIWAYFLTTTTWWKSKVYEAGACCAIVGSGNEENRNNSYPLKSALAQPSGLGLDATSNMCYIADSESSTIRQLNIKDGQVKGLVGGERDPMNLFAYGDVDGKGVDAKLQHPLAVCHIPDSQYIAVCDSYNHKLKLVDTKTKMATTLPITGLSEPGGLSYHTQSRSLYIADTNNHSIKRVVLPADLSSVSEYTMEEVNLEMPDNVDSPRKPLFDPSKKSVIKVTYDAMKVSVKDKCVIVRYRLPEDSHVTDEAESMFRATISLKESSSPIRSITRVVVPSEDQSVVNMCVNLPVGKKLAAGRELVLTLELLLYYCGNTNNLCQRICALITQHVHLVD